MPSFFQGISRRNLGVAVVALGIALVLGVYLIFTAPAQHTLSTTNNSLSSETALNASAESQYAATRSLGASAGALFYGEDSTIDALLPQLCSSSYEKPGCFNAQSYPLINIPAIANQTGMKVNTLAAGTADVYEGADYYQYSISLSGSYADLVSFVRKVTSSEPLVTLASVSASATPTGISATLLVNVWYANNPDQPPASATPASSGSTNTTAQGDPADRAFCNNLQEVIASGGGAPHSSLLGAKTRAEALTYVSEFQKTLQMWQTIHTTLVPEAPAGALHNGLAEYSSFMLKEGVAGHSTLARFEALSANATETAVHRIALQYIAIIEATGPVSSHDGKLMAGLEPALDAACGPADAANLDIAS